MVVLRGLGWLLLAMAVAAIVHDGLVWWTEGSFHLLGLGDLWSHLDVRSLSDVQSAVQRHVSAALWKPRCCAIWNKKASWAWPPKESESNDETCPCDRRRRSRGLS